MNLVGNHCSVIKMILESYKLYLKNRDSIINSNTKKSAHKSMVKQGALKILSKIL